MYSQENDYHWQINYDVALVVRDPFKARRLSANSGKVRLPAKTNLSVNNNLAATTDLLLINQ